MIHPNFRKMKDNNLQNVDIDSENYLIESKIKSHALIVESKEDKNLESSIQVKLGNNLNKVLVEKKVNPRFNLHVDKTNVVKFTSELLIGLDLTVCSNSIIGTSNKKTEFGENLSYNQSAKDLFKRLVLNKKGYLENESNYFYVDDKYVSENHKVVTLKNTRVLLYWSGIELNSLEIKRILTVGLNFLIGNMSYAELYYFVSTIIPKGTFEVEINYKANAFVLIIIEERIFSI